MTTVDAVKKLQGMERTLLYCSQTLDLMLLQRGDHLIPPDVQSIIDKLKTATDGVAARIARIMAAGGLSPEAMTALQLEVDNLTAMGQDPTNPLPPPVLA